jgi:spore germination protein GerM
MIVGAGAAAALLAAAAGALIVGNDDSNDADGGAVEEPTTAPTTVAPTTEAPATTGTEAPAAQPGGGTVGPGTTEAPVAETMQLTVWFLGDDVVLEPFEVTVPVTDAVARAALTELLKGPEAAQAGENATAIPAGTRLLDIAIADGTATVDLSREFGSGGGSASMSARVAQVVYTLTEFDTVNAVTFWMEGQPIEALGGEGLILDQPQTRADWADFAP